MKKRIACCFVLLAVIMLISACSPSTAPTLTPESAITIAVTSTPATAPAPTVEPVPTAEPSLVPASLPEITLGQGGFYFSVDGRQEYLLSRNVTGKTREDFTTLLEYARQGGTKLLRIHLTHGWWGDPWINKDWTVNEKWAQNWDWFFDQAEADGIYVLPVFAVWADWNTGKPDYGSPLWQYNPLNKANGGPLDSPAKLFEPGSSDQKLWLKWVETLVKRWQGRSNVAGWELFSEINIASAGPGYSDANGAVSEAAATQFVNAASDVVRTVDTKDRPLTLSLAVSSPSTGKWGSYYENDNIDFIQIHPYIDTLDRELVSSVRKNLDTYNKPVMIGECGLWSSLQSLEPEANPLIGIKHAIWAGVVSGAMNGRSLWVNDGYAIYFTGNRKAAFDYLERYATTELPAAEFVKGTDFAGFAPLESKTTKGVWGAAVGNESNLMGWFRDAGCEPPDYKLKPVLSGQSVTITVSGTAAKWQIDFYSTKDGLTLLGSVDVTCSGKTITIPLPDFSDDIAFKAHAK